MPIQIRFQNDPAKDLTFDDAVEKIGIGRDPARCQVVFPEDASRVGRQHCMLEKVAGRYRVRVNQEDPVLRDGQRLFDGEELPLDRECKLQLGVGGPLLMVRASLPGVPTDLCGLDPQPDVPTQVRMTARSARRGRLMAMIALCGLLVLAVVIVLSSRSQNKRIIAASAEPQLAAALNKAVPSVYLVLVQDRNKFLTPEATAWVVDQTQGLLATNAHVAELFNEAAKAKNGSRLVVHAPKGGDQFLAVDRVQIHPAYDAWQKMWNEYAPVEQTGAQSANIVQMSAAAGDVALLHVENSASLGPALTLADASVVTQLNAGEPVGYVGYPMEGLSLGGALPDDPVPFVQIGSIQRLTDYFGVNDGPTADRLLVVHSIAGTGGCSGSPILNSRGQVIAVECGGDVISLTGATPSARIGSSADVNFGQRSDLVRELLTNTAQEQLAGRLRQWQDELSKHFQRRGTTLLSMVVPFLTDQFKTTLVKGIEYTAVVAQMPGLTNVALDKAASSTLPEWDRQVDIGSDGIYLFAVVGDGGSPLRLTVAQPLEGSQTLNRSGVMLGGVQYVPPFDLSGPAKIGVSVKSLTGKGNVYLTVLRGTRTRRPIDDLHQQLATAWADKLQAGATRFAVVEAGRLQGPMPPPPDLATDSSGANQPGSPAEKDFKFPEVPAGNYLVTLVTKNGEPLQTSVTNGQYVTSTTSDSSPSTATGACLSFQVLLWDGGAIDGKLLGDRRLTTAVWSDAAGNLFLAPAGSGDPKLLARDVEYDLRLYRASEAPPPTAGSQK